MYLDSLISFNYHVESCYVEEVPRHLATAVYPRALKGDIWRKSVTARLWRRERVNREGGDGEEEC
ncbi:hypothetical protein HI914_02911 [Erysiphe necator]|nr:hypothetical protein HI914_02911 [Erysiphe necator]